MLKILLNIAFFISLNLFLKKTFDSIDNYKKTYALFMLLFFIFIILLGQTYDYLYNETIMLKKEKFFILLLFSFSSLIMNLTHIKIINTLGIKNKLKNNFINSILDIKYFSFILILITLAQLIFILDEKHF
ncbi:MAG: hypothetical protein QM535_05045 [Limnohabitans sp.]|nr:hypothetical protein [Limnohabitans sp.]